MIPGLLYDRKLSLTSQWHFWIFCDSRAVIRSKTVIDQSMTLLNFLRFLGRYTIQNCHWLVTETFEFSVIPGLWYDPKVSLTGQWHFWIFCDWRPILSQSLANRRPFGGQSGANPEPIGGQSEANRRPIVRQSKANPQPILSQSLANLGSQCRINQKQIRGKSSANSEPIFSPS